MKRISAIVAAIVLALALATTASAATLSVYATADGGQVLDSYTAAQSKVLLFAWQPAYPGWTTGPYDWKQIGSYDCTVPPTSPNSFGIIDAGFVQGCLDPINGAVITRDGHGNDLPSNQSYLVKVEAPGYYQGKTDWVYMPAEGFVTAFVNLKRAPVSIYSSAWTNSDTGITSVWHYIFNDSGYAQRVSVQTDARFAGVTSEQYTMRGSNVGYNIPANGYRVLSEQWQMPNWQNGQTFGEENCVRAQVTLYLPALVAVESKACVPNYPQQ